MRVPVIPVGLNYFKGHKFRGRVVVEFGPPVDLSDDLCNEYLTDKKATTEKVLAKVTTAMRSVIVPAPDYATLQLIYLSRRLWTEDGRKLEAREAMDLNRRFALGVRMIQKAGGFDDLGGKEERHRRTSEVAREAAAAAAASEKRDETFTKEELAKLHHMQKSLVSYQQSLKRLGLHDHQVSLLQWRTSADMVGKFLYVLLMVALGAIPFTVFNLPAIAVAQFLATREQEKALKGSTVKIAARDVVLSYKILVSILVVPILYVCWALCLILFSGFSFTTITLLVLASPLFSYFGVKASEQGVRAFKDIVPFFKGLAHSREQAQLPLARRLLQKEVRDCVKMMGPRLGDIYYSDKVDWDEAEKRTIVSSQSDPVLLKGQDAEGN